MKILFSLVTSLLLAVAASKQPPDHYGYTIKTFQIFVAGQQVISECVQTTLAIDVFEEVVHNIKGPPNAPVKKAIVTVTFVDSCSMEQSCLLIPLNYDFKGSSYLHLGATFAEVGTGRKCLLPFSGECGEATECEEPQTFSFNAVLTPITAPVTTRSSYHIPPEEPTNYFSHNTQTLVDVTVDFTGTVIDGEPFIPDSIFANTLARYTYQENYIDPNGGN